jgi:hypothetical protein
LLIHHLLEQTKKLYRLQYLLILVEKIRQLLLL